MFIESGQLPEDKVLFSVFMERLYDSMLKKAEERQQDVTVMLLDYPYYGGLCGLEKYMEEGPEKGICTTLYEDDRKLDGSGYAPHLVELYSLCDISVLFYSFGTQFYSLKKGCEIHIPIINHL